MLGHIEENVNSAVLYTEAGTKELGKAVVAQRKGRKVLSSSYSLSFSTPCVFSPCVPPLRPLRHSPASLPCVTPLRHSPASLPCVSPLRLSPASLPCVPPLRPSPASLPCVPPSHPLLSFANIPLQKLYIILLILVVIVIVTLFSVLVGIFH